MKLLFKIAFCLFAGLCICTACKDSEETISGFTLDKEDITLGAEGGTENVQIEAEANGWQKLTNLGFKFYQPMVSVQQNVRLLLILHCGMISVKLLLLLFLKVWHHKSWKCVKQDSVK